MAPPLDPNATTTAGGVGTASGLGGSFGQTNQDVSSTALYDPFGTAARGFGAGQLPGLTLGGLLDSTGTGGPDYSRLYGAIGQLQGFSPSLTGPEQKGVRMASLSADPAARLLAFRNQMALQGIPGMTNSAIAGGQSSGSVGESLGRAYAGGIGGILGDVANKQFGLGQLQAGLGQSQAANRLGALQTAGQLEAAATGQQSGLAGIDMSSGRGLAGGYVQSLLNLLRPEQVGGTSTGTGTGINVNGATGGMGTLGSVGAAQVSPLWQYLWNAINGGAAASGAANTAGDIGTSAAWNAFGSGGAAP